MEDQTTITVERKDKDKFRKLAIDYKVDQYQLFGAMVKAMKQFKPELKELLK